MSDVKRFAPQTATVIGAFIVASVAMMIVPLPTWLLDLLLTCNLAISVALVLSAAYAKSALDLSSFPTLLVLTTLYRLSLNVSSVRLILLQADAGRVIQSFGSMVVRGDYVVGAIVFLILALVQYLVIARGAERVAEVAARFTLDAMPGKQLAIDAELRAGTLNSSEAQTRRATLGKEAQLYGSLDGAMRFVKGDAIAGLIILSLSLVGGLLIGVFKHGMPLADAARLYTLLTIGDGLVSQLPALLISVAAGLVVTRVSSDEPAGADLARLVGDPRVIGGSAILLLALSLVPGLPLWPFALVGLALSALWWRVRGQASHQEPSRKEPLELLIEPNLSTLIPDLESRLRQSMAEVLSSLGLSSASFTISSAKGLPVRGYQLRLRGTPLLSGQLPDGRILAACAIDRLPPSTLEGLESVIDLQPARHPETGAPATWVPVSAKARLAAANIALLDPVSFAATQIESALRKIAGELVGVEETERLIDTLRREAPALVRATISARLEARVLTEVLRRLVSEGVTIRNLRDVLEALAREKDLAGVDAAILTERVRAALKRQISFQHARGDSAREHLTSRLEAILFDGTAEEAIRGALRSDADGAVQLALEPELCDALLRGVKRGLDSNERAVIVTSVDLRRHVRKLLEVDLPRLPVLSYQELVPELEIDSVATVSIQ